jgi:hypothetical protein
VARVGKSALEQRMTDPHDELLEGICEHANQVYERLEICRVRDPQPRDFVLIGLALKAIRELNGQPELPRDVVVGTFLWLVPAFER